MNGGALESKLLTTGLHTWWSCLLPTPPPTSLRLEDYVWKRYDDGENSWKLLEVNKGEYKLKMHTQNQF